ncbi:ribosome biogenesis protein tsr1 [Vanrija albida]|uniref:Ribosome biogenesis protein tsr1 n=1 Tax=Vanrija albida TaxID=181172 RepID=A0ABR3Q190_9TREE
MAPHAHHHRATLKQSNKGFKSRHASKGSLKAAAKGKPASPSHAGASHKAVAEAGAKKARLNQQSQRRDAKQRANREDAKFFQTSSGGGKVPRIVSIVPMLPSLSGPRFLADILPSLGISENEAAEISSKLDKQGASVIVPAPKFKTTLQINLLPPLELYTTLDAALVSDTIILLLSSTDEVQLEGEAILRCLQGQVGKSNIMTCVQAPLETPLTPSTRSLVHKSLLSFSRYFFPSVDKIHSADTPAESLLLARALCEASPSNINHPEGRAFVVAEGDSGVHWEAYPNDDGSQTHQGLLRITGTVRGGRLSANRLVHIPGHGDFQVSQILAAPPLSLHARRNAAAGMTGVEGQQVALSTPDESAEDLVAHNVPDLLANEQTWPTEEEMDSAPAASGLNAEGKRVKRVPKGTSAYQAAWIVDEDDVDDLDDAEDMSDDEAFSGDEDNGEPRNSFEDDEEEEEMEEVELDSRVDTHKDMAPEEEEEEYETYLRQRERAQQDDMSFPDEIDTPRHLAARTRFQRYRGLRSFRTSPWDPYENLPLEYGEIFQFENFSATQKRVEREAREDGVEIGTRVSVVIKDVPREVLVSRNPRLALIVHGLLQHEHKQTVLHFAVQRNTEFTEPVRAKEPLVLCVGPRRLVIRPLFSQHVRGGGKGVNNVHKSERFLKPGTTTVVSTFGPVCFGKSPCLLLRQQTSDGVPDLVATGSFTSSDPTRIIAKRIVLTGHPFKVHKKTATIRYMFFDREDVSYFQSVELHTKYGRTGHIREPLGTHGYFKAHFDGPVQQMDTVCMSLYKRQFPKWSEDFKPPQGTTRTLPIAGEQEMDVE